MQSEEQPIRPPRFGPTDVDRRNGSRQATLLDVAVLSGPGRRILCLIRDLSPDGMRVRLFAPRFAGERVDVELPTGVKRAARIAWVAGDEAGLDFEPDLHGREWAPPPGWRLRTPRIGLDHLAMVRHGAEISFVTARDIGPQGVNVETERKLGEGRSILFTIEGLAPMRGVVCWEDEGRCGIGFDRPLAVADLVRWLDLQSERRA